MENQEIEIELNNNEQELQIDNSDVVITGQDNVIESISVNGVEQTVDENKNVDITMPTKLSDLSNDNNTVQDANYVHTDNNYTTEEKTKLAGLENYDDTTIKGDIANIKAEQIQQNTDISQNATNISSLQSTKANKSEIPTALKDLSDDSTHRVVTDTQISNWNNKSDFSGSYNDLSNKPTIPTKTSDLSNDSGFITNVVDNLTNYYKKTETYTQAEVNSLIGAISTMDIRVVETLPTQDISTTTIYLLPKQTTETQNIYDEYIYVSNSWEQIGSTDVDLSGYQTKIDSTHKLNSDLVDDTNQTNKFVTATEKTTWNNKSDFSGDYTDLTNKPTIPDDLADLNDDSTHRLVTDTEKTTWNGKSDFSGSYNDLTDKPTIPAQLTAGTNIDITNNVISATDTTYTAGTGIDITNNVISNTQTSAEWGNITGTLADQTDLNTALGNKQEELVSGTNIKTINNESILGSGNLEVGGNEVYIGEEQDAPATTKLVIEEQQAEWNGLPISNTYNTTTNNTYSCDYINTKANTYSTTEQRVGTWIDNKPIYRRVIQTTLPNCTTTGTSAFSEISLDFIIDTLVSTNLIIKGSVFQSNLPLYRWR